MLGSSVHGIFQARILEWVAISYSRDLPEPGIKSTSLISPELAGRLFTIGPPSLKSLKDGREVKWHNKSVS